LKKRRSLFERMLQFPKTMGGKGGWLRGGPALKASRGPNILSTVHLVGGTQWVETSEYCFESSSRKIVTHDGREKESGAYRSEKRKRGT